MAQFITLLKLEFLSKVTRVDGRGKVLPRIFKYLISVLGAGVVCFVILYAFRQVIVVCTQYDIQNEFIIFYALVVQIVQFLFGISLTTKTLFFEKDSDKLKFPVGQGKLFLAKVTYLFLTELVFVSILSLPVFIMFGIVTMQPWWFFVNLVPMTIFLPAIPFLFSLLCSVPAMFVVSFLRNKFVIMLLIYIGFVAIGFYVYVQALSIVMEAVQTNGWEALANAQLILNIKNLANNMIFTLLFKNCLLGYKYWQSLTINVASVLFLFWLVYVIFKKLYFKMLYLNIEGGGRVFRKNKKIKYMSVSTALFNREFLTIFRSVNYSFQYLTIVITTPLMVYFSNVIASNVGVAGLGSTILPGVSVLVLLMFISMGTSFAATSISREGDNFFYTKVIPVSYSKQVFIKFLLYVVVAFPSILISCLILSFVGFISYLDAFLIALAVSMVTVANICKSINIDIKRPKFMYLNGKEITSTNSNINSSLSIGFVVASVLGIASIVVSYVVSMSALYLVLFSFGATYCAFETFNLFFRLDRKYKRIEA